MPVYSPFLLLDFHKRRKLQCFIHLDSMSFSVSKLVSGLGQFIPWGHWGGVNSISAMQRATNSGNWLSLFLGFRSIWLSKLIWYSLSPKNNKQQNVLNWKQTIRFTAGCLKCKTLLLLYYWQTVWLCVCVFRRMVWHPTVWRKNWRWPRTGGASGPSGQLALAHVVEEWWHRRDTASNRGQSVWLQNYKLLLTAYPNAHAVISLIYYSSKCLSFTSRKKVVAGKDNMTCTGTAKKYHLCNSKVSHGLPVNLSSLCVTSLLKQTPSLWLHCWQYTTVVATSTLIDCL